MEVRPQLPVWVNSVFKITSGDKIRLGNAREIKWKIKKKKKSFRTILPSSKIMTKFLLRSVSY